MLTEILVRPTLLGVENFLLGGVAVPIEVLGTAARNLRAVAARVRDIVRRFQPFGFEVFPERGAFFFGAEVVRQLRDADFPGNGSGKPRQRRSGWWRSYPPRYSKVCR